ncbi:DUF2164 domain-containing protein [Salimicrobium halophilum]|uniref:Uncharacterized conserved protein, DUF2164 family n=1 Tax=Salimicrobium halophilum TaxID=86666 RepID=A0A1G8R3T2_9BACI|nr:DUF2164 domain-containing protein [Salimicrobium halophilum]SDJ11060.1 Uncharacterized conserved protein, DUF2164 family [Salimicrobium halophilum]
MDVPKGQKKEMKERIQTYIYEEHGEEIGELAAENWLQFFAEELGVHFYNQGIADAKNMVEQKVMTIEEDLDSLKRPVRRG